VITLYYIYIIIYDNYYHFLIYIKFIATNLLKFTIYITTYFGMY